MTSLHIPTPPLPSTLRKVIFAMTGELVKFGVVMLVVMGGFVMAFYSLLRQTMSYGEVRVSITSRYVFGKVLCFSRKYTGFPLWNAQRTVVPEEQGSPVPPRCYGRLSNHIRPRRALPFVHGWCSFLRDRNRCLTSTF